MVEPENRSGSDLGKSFAYFQKILQQSGPLASASYGLLASVLIFTFLGWYFDAYNGSSPKGVLSGLAIGLIVGFYHLLKTVRTHKP